MNKQTITLYGVSLVCGAAPAIGCGSRAKPLLLDLELQPAIKEAWLNRTGTKVAIVWRGPAQMEEVGRPFFERHEVHYTGRDTGDYNTEPFRDEKAWFRGTEVDRLSQEEAREIAETAVKPAMKARLISVEEAAQIKSDIEAYFREELVKLRTKQELLEDVQGNFRQAVLKIFEKYLGTERTTDVARARGFQDPFSRTDRDETLSCCR